MRESREFRASLKKQATPIPDREINYFIHTLDPIPHKPEEYTAEQSKWSEYSSARALQALQSKNILNTNPRAASVSSGEDLCQICYQEITRKRGWCRMCGQECCEKCMARIRAVDDGQHVLFCSKCDQEYMAAMIAKEEEQMFMIREQAYQKLIHEQEMIQALMKIEKDKMSSSQQEDIQKNKLLQHMIKVTEISSINQLLKHEISETQKKIQWGQQIRGHLKKKLKRIQKTQSHSFASSIHDEHDDGWAPPKADQDEYVEAENLNESMINSILETEQSPENEQKSGLSCTCQIF